MKTTIENERVKITTHELGGELVSLVDKATGKEHLWQGSEESWTGQSPTLFPIVGRLKDSEYQLDGKTYQMPSHGFASKLEHKLIQQSENRLKYELIQSDDTMKNYPFQFSLQTEYKLEENKLNYSFVVENKSSDNMPFSVGFHTAFNCPFPGEELSGYTLSFEKEENVKQLGCNDLLTGEDTDYLTKPIALDNIYLENSIVLKGVTSDYLEIKNPSGDKFVRLYIDGAPYLLIWSMGDPLEFVCIEPWYGLPDQMDGGDFIKKQGINILKPNEKFCVQQVVQL